MHSIQLLSVKGGRIEVVGQTLLIYNKNSKKPRRIKLSTAINKLGKKK